MQTDTTRSIDSGIDVELSPTTIFTLLANPRRRYALHYLTQQVGAVHLGEVAEQIALWEDEPTRDHYERVYTGLYHNHVPKLTEAGVTHYDPVDESIELRAAADALAPYLRLAAPLDIY